MTDQPVQPPETTTDDASRGPRRRFRLQLSFLSMLLLVVLAASLFALLRDTRAWVPAVVVEGKGLVFSDPCFTTDGHKIIVFTGEATAPRQRSDLDAGGSFASRRPGRWVLIDADTGERLAEKAPDGAWAGFLQDGRYLHAEDGATSLFVGDPGSPDKTVELKGGVSRPVRIRQSMDGGRILCVSSDGSAHVWDSRTGLKACQLDTDRFGFASVEAQDTADISPDGKRVAALVLVRSPGDRLCVWNADTGALTASLPNKSGKTHRRGSYRFVLRGTRILANSSPTALGVFNVDNGQPVTFLSGPDSGASPGTGLSLDAVDLSPDGSRLVICGNDGTAWEWDIRSGERRPLPLRDREQPYGVKAMPAPYLHYAPDNRRLISASLALSPNLGIWDVETGRRLAVLSQGKEGKGVCSPFSPDGRRVAVVHADGALRVWTRRRPEAWWGLVALPEFWTAALAAAALAAFRLRRRARISFPAPTPQG